MRHLRREKIEQIIAKITTLYKTGFVHILGSTVINKIIGFFCGILVVRFVSKAAFGEYSYALNIISLFSLASALGLSSGTFQLCCEETDETKKNEIYYYGSSIGVRINVILTIIIVIFSYFATLKIPAAKVYIVMMAGYPIINLIVELQQIRLRSSMLNKEYANTCTVNSIAVFVCSVIGSYFFEIRGLIIGTYLAAITTILIILLTYKVGIGVRIPRIAQEKKKFMNRLALVSMCNNGLSQLLYLLDLFVIGLVVANSEVIASYKVATVIPTAIGFFPGAVVTYIYPFFARNKDNFAWTIQRYKQLLKAMLVVNAFITIILLVGAKPLISTIYGTEYLDAVACFRILSVSYFFSGTFRIISGNLLVTQRKVEFNLMVAIISGIVNLLGNFLLIKAFGSIGAAITTLLVVLISSVISTTYYVKIINTGNKQTSLEN